MKYYYTKASCFYYFSQAENNINSKEIKSIYNPLIYNIDKLKSIIDILYPNEKINLNDLSSYLNEIKTKIDKIKID